MFYAIAVVALFGCGFYNMTLTPEKLEKINEKIQDPNKKKSLETMHKLGKLMIGCGIVFAALMFI